MNKIINLISLAAITISIVSMVASQAKAQSLSESLGESRDELVIKLKNKGDALKTEIANTDLTGTGQVERLINKVYFYEGQVLGIGGGTWTYLHEVQDALLAKIKATGQSGFTVPEQAAIDSFANSVTQSKQEHPSSDVLG
jgi:predicted HAD superfamily Cof-like phosphohydrolase